MILSVEDQKKIDAAADHLFEILQVVSEHDTEEFLKALKECPTGGKVSLANALIRAVDEAHRYNNQVSEN